MSSTVQGQYLAFTVAAGQDLSVAGAQFKALTLAGVIAANGATAVGILQTKPRSGENGTVGFFGRMKGYAGAAINSGASLAVTTSGFLIAYTATGSNASSPIGRALASAASGDIFPFNGNFVTGGLGI